MNTIMGGYGPTNIRALLRGSSGTFAAFLAASYLTPRYRNCGDTHSLRYSFSKTATWDGLNAEVLFR